MHRDIAMRARMQYITCNEVAMQKMHVLESAYSRDAQEHNI